MTVKTHTCYSLICDTCGDSPHREEFVPHWVHPDEAQDDARDGSEWWSGPDDTGGMVDLCEPCKHQPHRPVPSDGSPDDVCDRCGNEHDPEEN